MRLRIHQGDGQPFVCVVEIAQPGKVDIPAFVLCAQLVTVPGMIPRAIGLVPDIDQIAAWMRQEGFDTLARILLGVTDNLERPCSLRVIR
jgi:hypothetical protein